MKHAGSEAIARLAPLIAELREQPALRERSPGTFYLGSAAFLHFHEDAAGDFADLKVDGDWQRSRVVSRAERSALLRRVRGLLARPAAKRPR
jgi:hypothetical protein